MTCFLELKVIETISKLQYPELFTSITLQNPLEITISLAKNRSKFYDVEVSHYDEEVRRYAVLEGSRFHLFLLKAPVIKKNTFWLILGTAKLQYIFGYYK